MPILCPRGTCTPLLGLLGIRNERTSPSNDRDAPPDLISGIGRLELRPVNPAQRILSGISRQRSSSLGDSQRGRRSPGRIGRRRLSTNSAGSSGQRLITQMLTRDSSVAVDDSSVAQQAERVRSQAMGEEEEN